MNQVHGKHRLSSLSWWGNSSPMWNLRLLCFIHTSPPLDLILSQFNPENTRSGSVRVFFFNIISHLVPGLPTGLCSVGFGINFDNTCTCLSLPYAFYMSRPSYNWTYFTVGHINSFAGSSFKHTNLKSNSDLSLWSGCNRIRSNDGVSGYQYNCMKVGLYIG